MQTGKQPSIVDKAQSLLELEQVMQQQKLIREP